MFKLTLFIQTHKNTNNVFLVKIEPQKLRGTSELDKLLRLAEFEKNPKSILQQSAPKVIQSAVKAATPVPVKPLVDKPVKASSEAPSDSPKTSATVKVKETVAVGAKPKEEVKKVITKEKTPELGKKSITSASARAKTPDPTKITKEKTPEPKKVEARKERTPDPAKLSSTVKVVEPRKGLSEQPRSRSKSPAAGSRSKSPSGKSSSAAPDKQSLASKRAQRRERTIEMEKYVQTKLEQAKQDQEATDQVPEVSLKPMTLRK